MFALRWLFGLVTVLLAAPAGNPANPPPAAPAGSQTAQFEAQLKTLFDKADLDHDGYLDKTELARGFRGPKATPPEQGMYDDKGRLSSVYYQARSKYPEMVFLWAADKDGDNRVSWAEYRGYGLEGFAAQQKQQQAMQRALQSANRQASRNRATVPRQQSRTVQNNQRRQVQTVRNLQRQSAGQQQQITNYLQNLQNQQYNMQRAYQAAMLRQQQLLQQRANYVRQQLAAAYRVPQQHFQTMYHHVQRHR